MAESVKVRIFGQEYKIMGDKAPEEIEKIATYVDEKMRLIAKVSGNGSGTGVSALTALNIAEEYFDALSRIERLQSEVVKARSDRDQYLKTSEETKNSYIKTKEQMEKMKAERQKETQALRDLEKKCGEYENSIFDLQMENIQLKSELDKLNQSSVPASSKQGVSGGKNV